MPKLVFQKETPGADLLDRHLHAGAREARANWSAVVNTARFGQPVIVTEHGVPAAAFISIRQLRILDMIDKAGLRDKILNSARPQPR